MYTRTDHTHSRHPPRHPLAAETPRRALICRPCDSIRQPRRPAPRRRSPRHYRRCRLLPPSPHPGRVAVLHQQARPRPPAAPHWAPAATRRPMLPTPRRVVGADQVCVAVCAPYVNRSKPPPTTNFCSSSAPLPPHNSPLPVLVHLAQPGPDVLFASANAGRPRGRAQPQSR